jgi:hypothetical protein
LGKKQKVCRFIGGDMTKVTPGERFYFVIVGLSALWIGSWCYFLPTQVDHGIPWLIPPFHARFLGAMYLSAVTLTMSCAFSRYWNEVKVMTSLTAVWTGVIFIVSLFYLTPADYHRLPVWIWQVAYFIYPVIALWLLFKHRGEEKAPSALPLWIRIYFWVQGIVLTLVALAMLLFPSFIIKIWPWKITLMLTQIYSAPFFTYGLGSLQLARQRTFSEIKVVVIGTFVFTALVLLASILHRAAFSTAGLSGVIWWSGFIVATSILGIIMGYCFRRSQLGGIS